jgi:protein-S-isoprenylcysteine O-methyltransferase Ste14
MFSEIKESFFQKKNQFWTMSSLSKLLVFLQLLCLACLMITNPLFCQGLLLILQVFGILITVWGMVVLKIGNFNIQPEVKRNAQFIITGPYKWIRNPMYLGILLYFGASVIQNPKNSNLIVFILLTFVFYVKILKEEQYLENQFGEIYLKYKQKTHRLIPYFF